MKKVQGSCTKEQIKELAYKNHSFFSWFEHLLLGNVKCEILNVLCEIRKNGAKNSREIST